MMTAIMMRRGEPAKPTEMLSYTGGGVTSVKQAPRVVERGIEVSRMALYGNDENLHCCGARCRSVRTSRSQLSVPLSLNNCSVAE